MTDGGTDTGGTERWSPNRIEHHKGDKECNYGGCRLRADWDIELINRHANLGLVRACGDHVAEYWGYHPDESDVIADGGFTSGSEHPTPTCPMCGDQKTRPLDSQIAICFDCDEEWRDTGAYWDV